jgi:molecular chaperone GrpE
MTKENLKTEDVLDAESIENDLELESESQDEGEHEAEADEINTLKAALEESESKAAEYLDGWQRARAEFANFKKRTERERIQTRQNITGDIAKQYLAVVDDLERALKERPQDGDATFAEGIELIYRKLTTVLEIQGVKPMQAEGEIFDPTLHEAIAQSESDEHESGQIIEVVQCGYLIGDRVLRPAMVRVAA